MADFIESDGKGSNGPGANVEDPSEEISLVRIVGWISVALGMAALGLYAGHQLRSRYKFNKRTPYDIFSHAGDRGPAADYGVGI